MIPEDFKTLKVSDVIIYEHEYGGQVGTVYKCKTDNNLKIEWDCNFGDYYWESVEHYYSKEISDDDLKSLKYMRIASDEEKRIYS